MIMNDTWNKIEEIICKSKYDIKIFEGKIEQGKKEFMELKLLDDGVLFSVVTNCSGIYIDNWLRILGQGSNERNGILYYNKMLEDSCMKGMCIVANDVVGGLYAINLSRYEIEKNMVWYFAPDTLEWETLGMRYLDFVTWSICGDICKFYETMRWNTWRMDSENLPFNKGYLIYPFLWAKECDINTASKKIVMYDEIINLNFDCFKKLHR